MDSACTTCALYALGAAGADGVAGQAQDARCELSQAKHRSLAGHARMARRIAALRAVLRVRRGAVLPRRRRAGRGRRSAAAPASMRLAELYRDALRRDDPRSPREVADGISDLQFTDAYRVPFQFSRLRARAPARSARSSQSSSRRDGHRSRRQPLLRPDRLLRRQPVRLRLLQGVHRARRASACASSARCSAPYHPVDRRQRRAAAARSPASTKCRSTCRAPRR